MARPQPAMNGEFWLTVLSSSALSGLLVALVAGAFGLRAKRSEYVNEYHRRILDKRIDAYASVEQLVFGLKNVSVGTDGGPCHLLFAMEEGKEAIRTLLFALTSQSLWLSGTAADLLQRFMDLFYGFDEAKESLESFGQRHYAELGALRVEFDRSLADDLLKLDDVAGFLKAKRKVAHGYRALAVGPEGIRELGRS